MWTQRGKNMVNRIGTTRVVGRTEAGRRLAAVALLSVLLLAGVSFLLPAQDAPQSASARELVIRGVKLLQHGKAEDAEPLFRRALSLEPDDALAWFYLGQDLMAQNRYSGAAEALESALESDRKNPSLNRQMRLQALDSHALALAFDEHFPKAVKAYKDAIEAYPDYPLFYYNLACVEALVGDRPAAFKNLAKFQENVKNYPPGGTPPDPGADPDLRGLKGDPRFEGLLIGWVGTQPSDTAGSHLMRKGARDLALGKTGAALSAETEAVKVDPKNVLAWYFLGGAHSESRQPGPAAEAYRKALSLDSPPNQVLTKHMMRWIALHLGKYDLEHGRAKEALRVLNEAETALAFDPLIDYQRARAYVSLHDEKKAFGALSDMLNNLSSYRVVEGPMPDPSKDPLFKPYLKDKRWAALIQKIVSSSPVTSAPSK